MQTTTLDGVAHVIQLALTPIFLLSGVASLLNVFSTRLGRVADQVDAVIARIDADEAPTGRYPTQLAYLRRRSRALDGAVILASPRGSVHLRGGADAFPGGDPQRRGGVAAVRPVRRGGGVHHRRALLLLLRDAAGQPRPARPILTSTGTGRARRWRAGAGRATMRVSSSMPTALPNSQPCMAWTPATFRNFRWVSVSTPSAMTFMPSARPMETTAWTTVADCMSREQSVMNSLSIFSLSNG